MYVNKCTKCGAEFETKNPKRVICPNCLYADKKSNEENGEGLDKEKQTFSSYSTESFQRSDERPRYNDRPRYDGQRNYNQQRPYGQQQRPQRPYNRSYDRPQRPYDRNNDGYQRQGGYQRPQGNYQRPQQGGYNRKPQGGYRPRPPKGPQKPPKQLLVNKEQLLQIEELYKKMLPLPNPDAHEVIAEQIGLEARKVFFGINLVRQKMMLPKLPFPKRKLAVSPDQLTAIKALYEPLLPLPPIGCHKIIAAQLKIDEWRVHVGIGLVRKQMGLDRWNPDREDAPSEFKTQTAKEEPDVEPPKKTRTRKTKKTEETSEDKPVENE